MRQGEHRCAGAPGSVAERRPALRHDGDGDQLVTVCVTVTGCVVVRVVVTVRGGAVTVTGGFVTVVVTVLVTGGPAFAAHTHEGPSCPSARERKDSRVETAPAEGGSAAAAPQPLGVPSNEARRSSYEGITRNGW